MRLLGYESVALDSSLKVVKVGASGLTNHHPKQAALREQTGCSLVAVERGEERLVEFAADFAFRSDDAVYICGNNEATQRFGQMFAPA